jgi:putative endonuclease
VDNKSVKVGKIGESEAALFIERLGYQILYRNWRNGKDEIDIVALHNNWVVFVEVKARTSQAYGEPWQAIDQRKQSAMIRAAEAFILQNNVEQNVRFDVVSVMVSPDFDVHIELIENAFCL